MSFTVRPSQPNSVPNVFFISSLSFEGEIWFTHISNLMIIFFPFFIWVLSLNLIPASYWVINIYIIQSMRLILNEFTSHLSDITSISPKPLHFGHEERLRSLCMIYSINIIFLYSFHFPFPFPGLFREQISSLLRHKSFLLKTIIGLIIYDYYLILSPLKNIFEGNICLAKNSKIDKRLLLYWNSVFSFRITRSLAFLFFAFFHHSPKMKEIPLCLKVFFRFF